MAFLSPLFLLAAAAVAIPLALHLWNRRTSTIVEFPAVRLLQGAPVADTRQRHLRRLVLLALRVAALLLLALAFARPYLTTRGASLAPVTVIALDRSFSLSAPGQIAAAREAAMRAVAAAPPTHDVALLTFADSATVIVAATADRGNLRAAVSRVVAVPERTRYQSGLAAALAVIGGRGGNIVFVTDLQAAGWDTPAGERVPANVGLEVIAVDAPPSNLAVTAARRDGDAVLASVQNFSSQPARVQVHLHAADRWLQTREQDIGSHGSVDVRFTADLPSAGGARVSIEDPGGYVHDDIRFLLLQPPARPTVFVVTGRAAETERPGLYVERALAAGAVRAGINARTFDGAALSALPPEALQQAGGVVLLGTNTLTRVGRLHLASFVHNGGRLLLATGPAIEPAAVSEMFGGLIVDAALTPMPSGTTLVVTDRQHPVFVSVAGSTSPLADVRFTRVRGVQPAAGQEVLARFTGGRDALSERSHGAGRVLVFTSDLDTGWNEFPLQPVFVPWLLDTARYLVQHRQQTEVFTLPAAPDTTITRPGLHVFAGRTTAVNVDTRESDPLALAPDEFTAAIPRTAATPQTATSAQASQLEAQQRLWQVALLAMLCALASEGWLGRRA